MPRRAKKEEPGVPAWVVTYGDMMTLLLCFFILLAAFSELKKEHEYQRVITAVKEAFGYSGGVGVMPTDDPPLQSMLELMEALADHARQENTISDGESKGMAGKKTRVTKLEEGLIFTIGGALVFDPGSATLKPDAGPELRKVADLLRGRRNRIDVRGHAARKRLDPGSPYADLEDLAFARARSVRDFLVAEGGLDPEVLRLEPVGTLEPLAPREPGAAANRRVEVVMTEVMVDDLAPEARLTTPPSAAAIPFDDSI